MPRVREGISVVWTNSEHPRSRSRGRPGETKRLDSEQKAQGGQGSVFTRLPEAKSTITAAGEWLVCKTMYFPLASLMSAPAPLVREDPMDHISLPVRPSKAFERMCGPASSTFSPSTTKHRPSEDAAASKTCQLKSRTSAKGFVGSGPRRSRNR